MGRYLYNESRHVTHDRCFHEGFADDSECLKEKGYLSGKLAEMTQNAKLLFVNYDNGIDLNLTETDTKDLIFQKLAKRR